MKVSSRRKDKFIVGEHTLHFPAPRSLSHRGVYPFPFGPAPHVQRVPSHAMPRQHFAIIFAIRMAKERFSFSLNFNQLLTPFLSLIQSYLKQNMFIRFTAICFRSSIFIKLSTCINIKIPTKLSRFVFFSRNGVFIQITRRIFVTFGFSS